MMNKLNSFVAGCLIVAFSGCGSNSSQLTSSANDLIPVDSANKMLSSYLNSIDTNAVTPQTYSLMMDAATLREYLRDSSIVGLKLMLAHPLDYINAGNEGINGGLNAGSLTIIVSGFDNDSNYVYAPGRMVANKAKICPPFCITSGSAAHNLLQ